MTKRGKPNDGRGTRELAAKRRSMIALLYRRGASVKDIHAVVGEKLGKLSLGHVKNVITELRRGWGEELRERKDGDPAGEFLELALADRRRALDAGDHRAAYAILKDIYLLLGVELKDPIQQTKDLSRLTTDEALAAEERRLSDLVDGDGRGRAR